MARRRGARRHARRGAARPAWREDGDDLPGSDVEPASVLPDRGPAHRGGPRPPEDLEVGVPRTGDRDAAPRRHPGARAARGRLSAPALRRDAPARDDRDGADQLPGAPDRGRVDHGARRDRAGADPGADRHPADGVRYRGHPDHARPRDRRRHRRRRGGHVRRPPGRGRPHPASLLHTRDAVHARAADVGPADGPRAHRPARSDPRQSSVRDQPAGRLRLPAALHVLAPGPGRRLSGPQPGASRGRARSPRPLPPAARRATSTSRPTSSPPSPEMPHDRRAEGDPAGHRPAHPLSRCGRGASSRAPSAR